MKTEPKIHRYSGSHPAGTFCGRPARPLDIVNFIGAVTCQDCLRGRPVPAPVEAALKHRRVVTQGIGLSLCGKCPAGDRLVDDDDAVTCGACRTEGGLVSSSTPPATHVLNPKTGKFLCGMFPGPKTLNAAFPERASCRGCLDYEPRYARPSAIDTPVYKSPRVTVATVDNGTPHGDLLRIVRRARFDLLERLSPGYCFTGGVEARIARACAELSELEVLLS